MIMNEQLIDTDQLKNWTKCNTKESLKKALDHMGIDYFVLPDGWIVSTTEMLNKKQKLEPQGFRLPNA